MKAIAEERQRRATTGDQHRDVVEGLFLVHRAGSRRRQGNADEAVARILGALGEMNLQKRLEVTLCRFGQLLLLRRDDDIAQPAQRRNPFGNLRTHVVRDIEKSCAVVDCRTDS